MARYLSVESQAGRVAGREAERDREGGRALPGRRECNLQIRGARRIPAASLTLSRQWRSQSEIEISGQKQVEAFFSPSFPSVRVSLSRGHSLDTMIHAKCVWSHW